ncbi:MAG: hypothetical protein KDD64_04735 [Bdellovibrionales bacterium]|nr:hypothetical protein [Bdellovibrionales bacterium]
MVKYEALIIDPDLDRRMRLKSATTSVVQFRKVHLLNSLEDATSRLNGGSVVDVIFITSALPQPEIATFIRGAKELKTGQDAAYILVLQAKDQESSTVASTVMIGADGLLFEPYSVDQLVEITELAARVKSERGLAREQAALGFLLNDIMQQIDMIAYLKSVGYDVGRGIKRFKQMCGVLNSLGSESLAMYYDLAVTKFSEAPFPKKMYQKNYKGASKRVKDKMEQKLLAKLEEGLSDDGDDADDEESASV